VQTVQVRDNCACVERADRKPSTVIVLGLVLAACPCASALNPSFDINQYAHNAWTVRDGFFKGVISSIAQTPNGYLWLGTEFGLLRFDGVRYFPWQPPVGENLPSSYVTRLLAERDGRLWIGTDKGLASWNGGKLTRYPELAGQFVNVLLKDREGTIWAGVSGTSTGRLCAVESDRARCYGEDGSFGGGVLSLYEDGAGNLWAGGFGTSGLWRWKPGSPKLYPIPGSSPEVYSLTQGDNGALLIAMRGKEIRQLVGGKVKAYSPPGARQQFNPNQMLRDRNGGLWIGTSDRGLLHVHRGRTDLFARSDGLSGDFINGFFEDREGNIWVATANGLDRFRDVAIPTISVKQGLSTATVVSVLAARDGSVWLATLDGLNKWYDSRITIYRQGNSGLPSSALGSLSEDDQGRIWVSTRSGVTYFETGRFIPVSGVPAGVVHSIAGNNAGNLWISEDQGLFRLLGGSVVERIPWSRMGRTDYGLALFPDPLQDGIWLGFFRGGVAYFKDGQIRASYAGADGLGEGRVDSLQLDRDGTLWAATEGGLSRGRNGRIATLTKKNGLPCDTVHWVMEDDDHSFWLYTACGLVRIARTELDAWVADSKRTIQATVFDSSDGAVSHARPGGYKPRVAKSTDGKLWFVTGDGVSVLDPRHLPINTLPPPVHIEQITADRKLRWQNLSGAAASNLRLPALIRDLQIDYTALSFVAPERVRFRVKLEGHDPDWKDAGTERKAFYNDLPPRHYRFRVMACNNSGVWNEAGDFLDFSIAPAYYQTTWFLVSCVGAFFVLLWGLYRYRLYQVAREFNANLEGRVEERLRVARELHDTLLQSFHGLLFRFSGG
jgi:ligand-binding sensor domain-containing protein